MSRWVLQQYRGLKILWITDYYYSERKARANRMVQGQESNCSLCQAAKWPGGLQKTPRDNCGWWRRHFCTLFQKQHSYQQCTQQNPQCWIDTHYVMSKHQQRFMSFQLGTNECYFFQPQKSSFNLANSGMLSYLLRSQIKTTNLHVQFDEFVCTVVSRVAGIIA